MCRGGSAIRFCDFYSGLRTEVLQMPVSARQISPSWLGFLLIPLFLAAAVTMIASSGESFKLSVHRFLLWEVAEQ